MKKGKIVLLVIFFWVLIMGLGVLIFMLLSGRLPNQKADAEETQNVLHVYEGTSSSESQDPDKKDLQVLDDGGIFSNYYKDAQALMSGLTIEEKVGQMILGRCPAGNPKATIDTFQPGGYVLFKNDFDAETEASLTEKLKGYQELAKIPMILATDEEGGTVVRVSSSPLLAKERFESPMQIYNARGMPGIKSDAQIKAGFLKEFGINVNLAPVADVVTDSGSYMYNRSLGRSPELTAEYVANVVEISQSIGVSCTLKHFPGYGDNLDTHQGTAVDNRSYEEVAASDFIPFQAGIDAGAHAVLVSHNIWTAVDADNPASLSFAVHQVLRNDLGFTGIIMTDDLVMDAVTASNMALHPAVAAVLAGNDMMIVTDIEGSYNAILEALEDGIISEIQIDQAVMRILAWKYTKKML